MIENFDIINIEYMEGGEETFDYPEEMLVSVETKKDDHYTHTKDSIRAKIKSYIRRNFGKDVEVVDFLAFPVGSNIQLGQLSFEFDAETFESEWVVEAVQQNLNDESFVNHAYAVLIGGDAKTFEEKSMAIAETMNQNANNPSFTSFVESELFSAETFEAREKKIGGQTIVKNPNSPIGTSLKAYMKTSKGELRKIFGNPNYEGMTGKGSYNLVLGGKRVTIYDYRESGKRGMKYFNVGGDSWFAPIILAQIISAHRGEKVYAKEMSPQWLEDERRRVRVQSIDEHPDLTYEKAKRYYDYKYKSAETFDVEFNEWAEQEMMTHGKDISFKDWAEDEGMKHGDVPITEWAQHEDESHDARYGAETSEDDYVDYTMWIYTKSTGGLFSGEWEDGESEEQVVKEWKELVREAIEQNGDDLITADLRKHSNYDEDGVAQSSEFLFQYEHGEDNLDDFESENWGGDPEGQLATALRNARIKAKQPKKPLKIEKLDAEFLYYYVLNEKGESPADFDTLEEAQAYVANSSEPLEIYERRSRDDEAYKMDKKMNAEGKKKKKLSGQLSDPFDELSLDSGDWKGIVAGFGVGLLALFGYSKLRK